MVVAVGAESAVEEELAKVREGQRGGDPSSEKMRRAKSATCGLEKEGHASPASSRVERRGGLTANWEEGTAGSRRT